jgi:hypothetical protein
LLTAYETQVKRLLQNPGAPASLYADSDLDSWINTARGQVAGEGECVRFIGTFAAVPNQSAYPFSGIAISNVNVSGPVKVINTWYQVGVGPTGINGQRLVYPRNWEWLTLYGLNNPIPVPGPPARWVQYGQGAAPGDAGSAVGGTLYLDPPPDAANTINVDCACYPIALVDNTTPEVIPYLWTDAVPFFAAYYALLSAQTSARIADAERLYNHYETFMTRARIASNPSQGRWQYQQAEDPVQALKLGLGPKGGG